MSLQHIKCFNYRDVDNILTVTFKGGTVSEFHPVNPETYIEILRAESLARVIHKTIRDGKTVGVSRGH